MKNWNIETDLIEDRNCASCGNPYQFKAGSIYDENGDSVALFLAEMHEHEEKRLVGLTIVLPVDDKRVKAKKNFVSLILWNHGGRIATSVRDETKSERGMTREEALASPRLPHVFEIGDFLSDTDPDIGPFLHGKDVS